jgi:hypothetical protein
MKAAGFATADELVRVALDALDEIQGEDIEDLDPATQAAIERAEAQSARGEGQPWEDVRAAIRAKYLDG